jgi:hypothetical protein
MDKMKGCRGASNRKLYPYWLSISTIFILTMPLSAQKSVIAQPTKADTSSKKKLTESDFPNPKKALLWSIAPGGGQLYNRKYWYIKAPIAYGGYGFGIERVITNGCTYRNFQAQYVQLSNSSERTNTNLLSFRKQRRDEAFKSYQQSWIFLTIWHLFCAAEAFTAAHLVHFDVNEDLSFNRQWRIAPATASNGIGIQFQF